MKSNARNRRIVIIVNIANELFIYHTRHQVVEYYNWPEINMFFKKCIINNVLYLVYRFKKLTLLVLPTIQEECLKIYRYSSKSDKIGKTNIISFKLHRTNGPAFLYKSKTSDINSIMFGIKGVSFSNNIKAYQKALIKYKVLNE